MLRHSVRQFRKCGICGTHGHVDTKCPLAKYEKELQAGTKNLITAEKLFPGNPELVKRLQVIEARYQRHHHQLTELDEQVAKLREAWGIA